MKSNLKDTATRILLIVGLSARRCAWSMTLVAAAFSLAGCALWSSTSSGSSGSGIIPMCKKEDTGYGVIFYYDRNNKLYSVMPQALSNPNPNWTTFTPGGNITSRNARDLIEENRTTPFHKDADYPFHAYVSSSNTYTAVYAIMDDGKCADVKCLFQAKSTETLKRNLTDNNYQEDCHEKTCVGAYKCGLYWCCK